MASTSLVPLKNFYSKKELAASSLTHVTYTPHQNGVSKRKNRMLLEKVCAMVANAKTLAYLWAEAIATASYITNCSFIRTNLGVMLYEQLWGKKSNLLHLLIFGNIAWVHIHDEKRRKCNPYLASVFFLDIMRNPRCTNVMTCRQ